MTPPVWRRARLLGGLACVVALAGCGGPAAPSATAAKQTLTVEAWSGVGPTLRVPGAVIHPSPTAHGLPRAWIPLARIVPEGATVARGEALAELDAEVVRIWADRDRYQLVEQGASGALERLNSQRRKADLQLRRADLISQRGVLIAEIAATARRDGEQVDVARLELANAEASAARSAEVAMRTRELVAGGWASRTELLRAESAAAIARAEVELPRLRLDLAAHGTLTVTRRRKEFDLARLDADLAGVEAQIAALGDDEVRGKRDGQRDLLRLERGARQWEAIAAAPAVRAGADGVVRYRDAGVRAGAKLPLAPFAYVLDQPRLVVEVELPDRWRGLVRVAAADDAGAGRAAIMVPALGRRLAARVIAIAAAPESSSDGTGRIFRCQLGVLAPEPGLKPGMAAEAIFTLDAGAALAVVPTWCIADLREPTVELVDGTRRRIEGWQIGHRFVVLAGLTPGERIAVRDAPAAGGLRVVGVLAPERSQPIRIAENGRWGSGWELTEVVGDGAPVAAGEVVARLAKIGWNNEIEELRIELEVAEMRAAGALAQARSDAETTIAQAVSTWRQSLQGAERARLDLAVAAIDVDGTEPVVAAVADLVRAEVRAQQAAARLAELDDAIAASATSAHDLRARRLAVATAGLDLTAARLGAVGARRGLDYLALREAQATERDAEERVDLDRAAYSIARLAAQQRLAQAQLAWRSDDKRQRSNRSQAAGEAIRAPLAGRVFHRPRPDGRPLRVGDRVEVADPFLIPLGNRRRFTVELPARFYGRFTAGDVLPFVVPALGHAARDGTVEAVAAWFADPADARAERAVRGTVGASEKIFLLTIGFALTDDELDRAPPGATAYVDL